MFISFEGIDGAGKSTQIALLEEFLKSKGKDVLSLREPGGLQFSENIRNILLDNKTDINENTELMLFLSARSELTEKVIKPALVSGKVVICDRFSDSTLAYQGFGRGIDIEKIKYMNYIATNKLVPELTIYLKLDFTEYLKRNENKVKDRMEANSINFTKKVIWGFDAIAQMYPNRVKAVNASESIANVHSTILKYVNI